MKKICFLVIWVVCFVSCKEERTYHVSSESRANEFMMAFKFIEDDELLEYVLKDRTGCLHVTRYCDVLDSVYQVQYIDTLNLIKTDVLYFCSRCMNRKRQLHINEIIRRNTVNNKKTWSLND